MNRERKPSWDASATATTIPGRISGASAATPGGSNSGGETYGRRLDVEVVNPLGSSMANLRVNDTKIIVPHVRPRWHACQIVFPVSVRISRGSHLRGGALSKTRRRQKHARPPN